jgi:hypothetical protein
MLLGRPSSTRGAYAAATWAVNESLRRTLIGCSGSCSVGSWRRDRVEDCCLLHATLAVLDRVRCYIRGCWRKSPRAKCRLSGQTPRTKGASERRKARGEEGDGETKKEVVGARSVATESVFSCYLEHRRRRLSLPVPRAASSRRPSGFRPRASCARPPPRPSACRPTASAQPGADTCLGAAAPPEKAAHMLVGAAAEKLRRACCAQSSGSDPCVARAHTAEWRAAREASCAHGHADASEWQGPVAGRSKGVNHGGREPPVAPRLVPGSCRPRATATRGHCGPAQLLGGRRRQAQPERGAPRSTTRELATRNKVKSPSHFDASSVSPGACADQLVHGGKAATHEPSGGSSASAAWPSGRAEMPIERGGSPQRQLALCCRRILLPRDIVAVPSAGRDAVAREAASTLLLRTAPAGQYSSPISTPRLERAFARSSPDQQSRSLPRSWPEWWGVR